MCDRIYNRDTQEEIESQTDLHALVGPEVYALLEEEDPDPALCICDINHEGMLQAAGYAWEPTNGDTTDIVTYKLPQ